jgi:hypothetical protein
MRKTGATGMEAGKKDGQLHYREQLTAKTTNRAAFNL